MKLKIAAYAFLGLGFLFAGGVGYLYLQSTARSDSSPGDNPSAAVAPLIQDRGTTVSGEPGRLLIAYAGDIVGSLDPCG